jgi:hypothetical protein
MVWSTQTHERLGSQVRGKRRLVKTDGGSLKVADLVSRAYSISPI